MKFVTEIYLKQAIKSILTCFWTLQCCIFFFNIQCVISNEGIDFSLHDIMSSQMMPFHIFVFKFNLTDNVKNTNDYFSALVTMNYHRKMMQHFLAASYLSSQILNLRTNLFEKNLGRRLGEFQNISNLYSGDDKYLLRAPMKSDRTSLFNDGSSRYKAWLKSTATLEDIRNQLKTAANHSKNLQNPIRKQLLHPVKKSANVAYLGDEDVDSGDITGYASDGFNNDSNFLHVPRFLERNPNIKFSNNKEISKSGYDTPFDDYGMHHASSEPLKGVSMPTKQSKEISLKDITDIALTTLAFLSFGMFFLQVLMCITMSKEENNNLMMLPMEATETVDTNDGTEEIRRRKRSTPLGVERLIEINQLTETLLTTFDNWHLIRHNKNNVNMKDTFQLLCKYDTTKGETKVLRRIWSVLYSLGISWLVSRQSDDYYSIIKRIAQILEACT